MKNTKKILSVFMTIAFILTMTTASFAASLSGSTNYTLKLVASENVKAGENFTVSVYITDGENDIEFAGIGANIEVRYPETLANPTITASNGLGTNDCGFAPGFANIMFDSESINPVFNANTPICTLTFVALNAGDSYEFTVANNGILDYTGEEAITTDVGTTVTVAANTPAEPTFDVKDDEEVFEAGNIVGKDGKTIETTANTKSIAVFSKATKDLAAKEYGVKIIVGDKTYTFPGLEALTSGQSWAVKIISPDGTFNFANGVKLDGYTVEPYQN
jgi:hypothetical protein